MKVLLHWVQNLVNAIANAPNPAGFANLRGSFEDAAIHPMGLSVAAMLSMWAAVLTS